jgi:NADH dehydrogenase/NADH:ubiquinone oxidoreductase subunit G
VKVTAIARGSLKEAASLHKVPYSAVKMRASREKWPVGRRTAQAVQQAREVEQTQLAKISPQSVTRVTSTADALVTALAEDSSETRHDLSKAARKAASKLREMPGAEILSSAQDMKHVANTASMLHGWAEQGRAPVCNINLWGGSAMVEKPI